MSERGGDTVPDEFQNLMGWAKSIKDGRTERSAAKEKAPDITPQVVFYRDGEMVALGFARQVNRDEGLQMARMGRRVFSADRIEIAVDAHMADQRFYDTYGRNPDPHELANLCETEDACNIGLATDCIIVARAEKDGLTVINLPYHIDVRREEVDRKLARSVKGDDRDQIMREGNTYTRVLKTCHWQDDRIFFISEDESSHLEGFVPDNLRSAFDIPTLDDSMAELGVSADDFGLSPDRARLHQDIAAVRMMAQVGFAMALPTRNEEEREILEESMRRHGNVTVLDPESGDVIVAPDPDVLDSRWWSSSDLAMEKLRREMEADREKQHEDELKLTAERRAAREAAGGLTEDDIERYQGIKDKVQAMKDAKAAEDG